MRSVLRSIRQFLSELKRRNVYRVALAYLAAGFVVIELADIAAGTFDLPGWFGPMVWVVVGLGFPIALVLAWALEVTPEGVRVEEAEGSDEALRAPSTTRDLWVGMSVLVLLLLGAWWMWGGIYGGEATDQAREIDERSIAVLPFEALGKEEPGVFTEGMHDDLLTRLSNISDLKVISRTAVQQYRNTDLTTAEIADSLGVRWVMEGGVQEMGDRIQVNAQLIDPRSETHVWAEDYQRDLTAEDLFAIQGDITREIAEALEAELTAGEQSRITGAPTENLEAYRLYVKGRSQLDSRSAQGIRRAVDYFRQALRDDSTFALAWSGLADSQALFEMHGSGALPEGLPSQKEAAQRALRLAPDLAEAHASMGLFYIVRQNVPAALRHLNRAATLKPSYAQAHHWLGITWFRSGQLEKALTHYRLAVDLNPNLTTARTGLVSTLASQGALEIAEAQLGRFTQEQRQTSAYRGVKAGVLYRSGQWDRLEPLARKNLESGIGFEGMWRAYLSRIAAQRGDTAAVREHLAKVRALEDKTQRHFWEGSLYAVLGEVDSTFAAWRNIRDWTAPPLSWTFPPYSLDVFDPVREDPRYEALIEKVNRQWGLNPDGSVPEDTEMATDLQPDA